MTVINATDAKNRFGELLDLSQVEPVIIRKNGRDVSILISIEQYRQMEAQRGEPKVNPLVAKLHAESVKRWRRVYEALAK